MSTDIMNEKREFEIQVERIMMDVLYLLVKDDGYFPLEALDYFYLSRT